MKSNPTIWYRAAATNTTFRTRRAQERPKTIGGPLEALSRRYYRSETTLLVTLPLVSGCAGDGPDTAIRGSVGTSAANGSLRSPRHGPYRGIVVPFTSVRGRGRATEREAAE